MKALDELIHYAGGRLAFTYSWFSPSLQQKLGKTLLYADWPFTPQEYLSFCLACSLAAGLAAAAFSTTTPALLALGPLLFAACFYALASAPRHAAARRRRELEWEACFILRKIAAELDAGLCFEECMENAAGKTGLGREFAKIVREIRVGAGVPEALQRFALRTDSLFLKKVAAQIVSVYSHGTESEALRRTAEEQACVLRTRLKEYNSRLALHSLAFVACAAVVPAVFLVYATVGGLLSAPISSEATALMYFVAFPLLSLALFALASARRP